MTSQSKRTVLERFPAGGPRGSWPADEYVAQERDQGPIPPPGPEGRRVVHRDARRQAEAGGPWSGCGDVAVRIAPDAHALERGRPAEGPKADVDPGTLVLIHPDTETTFTGTLQGARARIHGTWTEPYRPLTHARSGRDLPPDIDLSTEHT